ncbi:MAG: NFACT family protein [Kosmotogaceae bacterium]|nr:NFACT family protein [Kosmotogaceae bacterium]
MVFDGLILQRVLAEISDLPGQQLRQIYQIGRSEFFFKFSKRGIEISIDPSSPYIIENNRNQNSQSIETPFSLFLRRHINGFFLTEIVQIDMDRITRLDFEGRDAFGERNRYSVIAEFIGPGSNIMILDEENRILQVFREMISSKRTLARNLEYYPPECPGKSLRDMSKDKIVSTLLQSTDILSKATMKSFTGFSRATAENIVGFLQTEDVVPVGLREERLDEVAEFLMSLSRYTDGKSLFVIEGAKGVEISPVPLDHKGRCEKVGASEAIRRAIRSSGAETEVERRKLSIARKIDKSSKRLFKLIDKLETELSEVENYKEFRKYGELITANLYKLRERKETVELEDWETGKKVEISLDSRLTPSENAQLFFKYYSKSMRKEIQLKRRLRTLRDESNYLEQLKEMVLQAESLEDIREFSCELEEAGIKRKDKIDKKRKKRSQKSGPRVFERDGFRFLVGRNNIENDEITKKASKDDIWFHARGIPGAHVILKKAGREITPDAIFYGSLLAAKYSRGRQSGKVDVTHTEVRNVKKPKGAKPGMVTYRKSESITVDLTKEMVGRD